MSIFITWRVTWHGIDNGYVLESVSLSCWWQDTTRTVQLVLLNTLVIAHLWGCPRSEDVNLVGRSCRWSTQMYCVARREHCKARRQLSVYWPVANGCNEITSNGDYQQIWPGLLFSGLHQVNVQWSITRYNTDDIFSENLHPCYQEREALQADQENREFEIRKRRRVSRMIMSLVIYDNIIWMLSVNSKTAFFGQGSSWCDIYPTYEGVKFSCQSLISPTWGDIKLIVLQL